MNSVSSNNNNNNKITTASTINNSSDTNNINISNINNNTTNCLINNTNNAIIKTNNITNNNGNNASTNTNNHNNNGSRNDSGQSSNVTAFLSKLWRLVNDQHNNDLICWSNNGCSFVISNQIHFAKDILPLYFKHSNMASFIRQLNMYGFGKIPVVGSNGNTDQRTDIAQFYHVNFLRGQECRLVCIKRKNNGIGRLQNIIVGRNFCDEVKLLLNDLRSIQASQGTAEAILNALEIDHKNIWRDISFLRTQHIQQMRLVDKLISFLAPLAQNRQASLNNLGHAKKRKHRLIMNAIEQANQLVMNVAGGLISSTSSSSSGGSRSSDSTPNDSESSEDLLMSQQQHQQDQQLLSQSSSGDSQNEQQQSLNGLDYQQQRGDQPNLHYQNLVNQHMSQQHQQNVQSQHEQQRQQLQTQQQNGVVNQQQHLQHHQHHDLINNNGQSRYQQQQQFYPTTKLTNIGNGTQFLFNPTSCYNPHQDHTNNTYNLEHMIIDTNNSSQVLHNNINGMENDNDHQRCFDNITNQNGKPPSIDKRRPAAISNHVELQQQINSRPPSSQLMNLNGLSPAPSGASINDCSIANVRRSSRSNGNGNNNHVSSDHNLFNMMNNSTKPSPISIHHHHSHQSLAHCNSPALSSVGPVNSIVNGHGPPKNSLCGPTMTNSVGGAASSGGPGVSTNDSSYFISLQNNCSIKPTSNLHGHAGGGSLPSCLDTSMVRASNYGMQHAASAPLPIATESSAEPSLPTSLAAAKSSFLSSVGAPARTPTPSGSIIPTSEPAPTPVASTAPTSPFAVNGVERRHLGYTTPRPSPMSISATSPLGTNYNSFNLQPDEHHQSSSPRCLELLDGRRNNSSSISNGLQYTNSNDNNQDNQQILTNGHANNNGNQQYQTSSIQQNQHQNNAVHHNHTTSTHMLHLATSQSNTLASHKSINNTNNNIQNYMNNLVNHQHNNIASNYHQHRNHTNQPHQNHTSNINNNNNHHHHNHHHLAQPHFESEMGPNENSDSRIQEFNSL